MQSIVNELINNSLKGVDTYRWKDATWLIFSEEFKWVIELTDGGTLWFNYKFFDNVLRYVSLDPEKIIAESITHEIDMDLLRELQKICKVNLEKEIQL